VRGHHHHVHHHHHHYHHAAQGLKELPGVQEMGLSCAPASLQLQLTGEAVRGLAQLPPITAGLASFMVPPKIPGGGLMIKDRGQLFDQMARLAHRTTAEGVDLAPSAFLDVAMGEDQARVTLNSTPQDYTMGAIIGSGRRSSGCSVARLQRGTRPSPSS